MEIIYKEKCGAYWNSLFYNFPSVEIIIYKNKISIKILGISYTLFFNEIKKVEIKWKLWIRGIFFTHDSNTFPKKLYVVSFTTKKLLKIIKREIEKYRMTT